MAGAASLCHRRQCPHGQCTLAGMVYSCGHGGVTADTLADCPEACSPRKPPKLNMPCPCSGWGPQEMHPGYRGVVTHTRYSMLVAGAQKHGPATARSTTGPHFLHIHVEPCLRLFCLNPAGFTQGHT